MAKSVTNVLFDGIWPITRISARLSFQRPEEAVNSVSGAIVLQQWKAT